MSGRRPGGAGVSHWWPTPARATDHFTAAQLARSAELHASVRRLRRRVAVGRIVLLLVSAVVLAIEPVGQWAGGGVVVPGLAVAVALVVPHIAFVDPPDTAPGSVGSAVLYGVALVVVIPVLDALAPPLLAWAVDPDTSWLVTATGGLGAVVVGVIRARFTRPGSPAKEVPARWRDLVRRAGLDDAIEFDRLDLPGGGRIIAACAGGLGSGRRILVSSAVLDLTADRRPLVDGEVERGADPVGVEDGVSDLVDFVIAHEIQHLARRHVVIALALRAVVIGGAFGSVAVLGAIGVPWSLIGADPAAVSALPLTILVAWAGLQVARLPVAWVQRGLERVADGGAVDLVGVPAADDARRLFLEAGVELAPPRRVRFLAAHPAPGERLEFFRRRRSLLVVR